MKYLPKDIYDIINPSHYICLLLKLSRTCIFITPAKGFCGIAQGRQGKAVAWGACIWPQAKAALLWENNYATAFPASF